MSESIKAAREFELKPCPFCGKNPQLYAHAKCYHSVGCVCGVIITRDSEREAAKVWNTRKVADEQTADLLAVINLTDEFVTRDWMISKKGDLVALRIFDDGETANYLHFDSVLEAFQALKDRQEGK